MIFLKLKILLNVLFQVQEEIIGDGLLFYTCFLTQVIILRFLSGAAVCHKRMKDSDKKSIDLYIYEVKYNCL
jgi:uncharacterized membrane protein YhaH (DUF805 family)